MLEKTASIVDCGSVIARLRVVDFARSGVMITHFGVLKDILESSFCSLKVAESVALTDRLASKNTFFLIC